MKVLKAIAALIGAFFGLAILLRAIGFDRSQDEEANRAKAAGLRTAFCTPDAESAVRSASTLRRWEPGLGITVDRDGWDALEFEHRAYVAAWASICKLDGEHISIKDSRTHERLGWYSPTMGFHLR